VRTTYFLSDFLRDGFWWFSADPAFPAGERLSNGGAWSSRASADSYRFIYYLKRILPMCCTQKSNFYIRARSIQTQIPFVN